MGANLSLGMAFGGIGLDAKAIPAIAQDVLKAIQRFQADFPETVFPEE